jgi:hypothetical protein
MELNRYEIDGEITTNWRGIFDGDTNGIPTVFQRIFGEI